MRPHRTSARIRHRIGLAIIFAILAAPSALHADAHPDISANPVSNPGAMSPVTPDASSGERRRLKLDYSAAPLALRIVLPPPGAAEEQGIKDSGRKGGLMIGFHRDVPDAFKDNLSPRLDWIPQSDGTFVSSFSVTSPGAVSVRVGIRGELPPGGEIRFFSEESDERFPIVTREDFRWKDGELETLWSPTVAGDTIGVEIALPSKKAMNAFSLSVEKVAHTFHPMDTPPAPKLDCPGIHIDVQCATRQFHPRKQDAVARIRYEADGSSYVCSGTLMNDAVQETFVPYFLTANHCVDAGGVARTVEAWWFYRRRSCGSSIVDSRFDTTIGGTELLATSRRTDMSLLRFRRAVPGGLWYTGWTTARIDHPAGVYSLHHPDGVDLKYSAGTTNGNYYSDGVSNAIAVRWREGTTEGGSSGAGLFLRSGSVGYLVGALSHGPACGYGITDHFGPFRDFFSLANRWIHHGSSPITDDDDHGDTPATATVVRSSTTTGILEQSGDLDYFRFTLRTAGRLRVYTTGSTDTYGTLTQSGTGFLLEDDDNGAGTNFLIQDSAARAGIYHVEVRGYTPGETGRYTLHIESPPGGLQAANHMIPLVPEASHHQLQGFVRVINRSNHAGDVSINAIDDTGRRHGPILLRLGAQQTRHFNSWDLENGDPSKGLSGGVGNGSGSWRLELRTSLDTVALAYIRTADGFLTSIHEVADEASAASLRYDLPFFNPASNRSLVSWMRLINPGSSSADITISGWDDLGQPAPGGDVRLTLRAGAAHMLNAQQLEWGDAHFVGRLGDGEGKWQLSVSSNHPLHVMSLMSMASGNLTNLTR